MFVVLNCYFCVQALRSFVQSFIYEAVINWHLNIILDHTMEFRISVETTRPVTTYKSHSDVSVQDHPHTSLKNRQNHFT